MSVSPAATCSDTGISAGASLPVPQSPTRVSRRNLPHWRRTGAIYWVTFRLADSLPQTQLNQLRTEQETWLQQNPTPWTADQHRDHEARFTERVQQWLDAGYGRCALARSDVRAAVRDCLTRFDGDRLHLHAAVIMPNHVHALIEPTPPRCDTGIPAGAPPLLRKPQTGMSVPPPASRCDTGIPAGAPPPLPQPQTRMSVPPSASCSDTGIPAGAPPLLPKPQTGMSVPQPTTRSDTGIPAGDSEPTVPAPDALSLLLKGIKGASSRATNRLLGQSGPFWMNESYDRIVRDQAEYRHFVDYIRANPFNARLAPDQYWLYLRS